MNPQRQQRAPGLRLLHSWFNNYADHRQLSCFIAWRWIVVEARAQHQKIERQPIWPPQAAMVRATTSQRRRAPPQQLFQGVVRHTLERCAQRAWNAWRWLAESAFRSRASESAFRLQAQQQHHPKQPQQQQPWQQESWHSSASSKKIIPSEAHRTRSSRYASLEQWCDNLRRFGKECWLARVLTSWQIVVEHAQKQRLSEEMFNLRRALAEVPGWHGGGYYAGDARDSFRSVSHAAHHQRSRHPPRQLLESQRVDSMTSSMAAFFHAWHAYAALAQRDMMSEDIFGLRAGLLEAQQKRTVQFSKRQRMSPPVLVLQRFISDRIDWWLSHVITAWHLLVVWMHRHRLSEHLFELRSAMQQQMPTRSAPLRRPQGFLLHRLLEETRDWHAGWSFLAWHSFLLVEQGRRSAEYILTLRALLKEVQESIEARGAEEFTTISLQSDVMQANGPTRNNARRKQAQVVQRLLQTCTGNLLIYWWNAWRVVMLTRRELKRCEDERTGVRSRLVAGLLRLRMSETLRRHICVCFELWSDLVFRAIDDRRLRHRFKRLIIESEMDFRALLVICSCWRTWAGYMVGSQKLVGTRPVDNWQPAVSHVRSPGQSVVAAGQTGRLAPHPSLPDKLAALTGRRLAQTIHALPTLRVVWSWRVRCVQIQKESVLFQCDRLRLHLAKVQRTAQTVRDHNQRVVALAVFQAWRESISSDLSIPFAIDRRALHPPVHLALGASGLH